MIRLALILIYILLSFIYYLFPQELLNDGKVFTFALICVFFLKELDWFLIKESCKKSTKGICNIFKKKSIKDDNKNGIELTKVKSLDKSIIKEFTCSENEEKSLKEKEL